MWCMIYLPIFFHWNCDGFALQYHESIKCFLKFVEKYENAESRIWNWRKLSPTLSLFFISWDIPYNVAKDDIWFPSLPFVFVDMMLLSLGNDSRDWQSLMYCLLGVVVNLSTKKMLKRVQCHPIYAGVMYVLLTLLWTLLLTFALLKVNPM